MSEGNAGIATRKIGNLLPPGNMIPAQSMRKHDRWSAARALEVDLGAFAWNDAARNSRVPDFSGLPLLRFSAARYQHTSSGEPCESREITTRNHGEVIGIVTQRLPECRER